MNEKKALEYLRFQRASFANTMAPEMKLAMLKAEHALERMIPEKPIEKDGGFGDKILSCPNCDNPVTNYWKPTAHPIHCQFCGQELDWSVDCATSNKI